MFLFFFKFFFFSDDETVEEEELSLSCMVKQSWMMKRKQLLEHDFAIAGWALSILLEIRDDVRLNLDGDKRIAIERVIAKLHVEPNPNSKVSNDEIVVIIDTFWKDFGDFQNKTGVYGLHLGRFLLPDAINGNSHLWHELYSLLYTNVVCFLAFHVTSKRLGVGSAKRDLCS